MKYSTKKSLSQVLLFAVAMIAILVILGMVTQGFQKWKWDDVKANVLEKVLKERNPDNLIKTVDIESGKDPVSDVSVKVDKYGRVTLNGTASEESAFIYAEDVVLTPGTYYLTGDDSDSSNLTEYLGIYNSSNELVKRADMGSFTVAAQGTYTIAIRVFEGAKFSNVTIAPVLSTDHNTPFFAEH